MDNFIFLGIFFTITSVVFYKIGIRRGINSSYAFADAELGVFFKSGNDHEETCNKIKNLIVERNRFENQYKDSAEIIKRLEWSIYWFCDSLHNIGHNYLFSDGKLNEKEVEELKKQIICAAKTLSCARSIFNARIIADDEKYLAIINFVEGNPSGAAILDKNICGTLEGDFEDKLEKLWYICQKDSPALDLIRPNILHEKQTQKERIYTESYIEIDHSQADKNED